VTTSPTNPMDRARAFLERNGLGGLDIAAHAPLPPARPDDRQLGRHGTAQLRRDIESSLGGPPPAFPFIARELAKDHTDEEVSGRDARFSIRRFQPQPADYLVYIISRAGGALAPIGDPSRFWQDTDTVMFDLLGAEEPVGVVDDEGYGVLLLPVPGGEPTRVEVKPRLLPAVALPAPPVEAWLAEDCEDAWLRDLAAERLAEGDPFDRLVLAGMLFRLADRGAAVRAAVRAELERDGRSPTAERERTWARTHGEATEWAAVGRRAAGDADLVSADLAALRADLLDEARDADWDETDEAAQYAHLRELRRTREGLEGVAELVRAAGGFAPLDDALAACDELGARLVRVLDHDDDVDDDPLLVRVSSLDPYAWWGATDGLDDPEDLDDEDLDDDELLG
jgi:hypothetical protein